MKKIFFLLSTLFALVLSTNTTNVWAKDTTVKTYNKGMMDIWAVAPTFYEGSKDVIVYSSAHPEGQHVDFEEVYIGDNGYSLFLASNNLGNGIRTSEGNYWALASTSGNDISLNTVAQCYIDTDPKSIYPDLSDEYSSYTLIPEPEREIVGYIAEDGTAILEDNCSVPEGHTPIYKGELNNIYHKFSGIPQIFCLFGNLETFPTTADEAEHFFVSLMKKYIKKKYETINHDYLPTFYYEISASSRQATGHFDDYFFFYKPLDVPMFKYITETKNDAVKSLAIGNSLTPLDHAVKEFTAYAEGLPNSYSNDATFEQLEDLYIKETWFYKAKDWGWDYYIDTRNLERDEDGYVCESVVVTADSNGKLLFPELGDKIPEDLPGFLGVLDTRPEEIQKPIMDDKPQEEDTSGESRFEVFPEDKEEEQKIEEKPPVIDTEEKKSSPVLPILVSSLILAGAIFFAIRKGKKQKK